MSAVSPNFQMQRNERVSGMQTKAAIWIIERGQANHLPFQELCTLLPIV